MDAAARNPLGYAPADFGFGTLFYSIPDAIVVCDRAGRIVLWNPAASALFGYGEAEALGENVTMLIPASHVPLHNAGMARFASTRTGPLVATGNALDLPAVGRDGRLLRVELRLARVEHAAASSEAPFALAILRDATPRYQARVARPLVQRLVRDFIEQAGVERAGLSRTGRSLSGSIEGTTIANHLEAFAQMGLGALRSTLAGDERYEFEGEDLIERREGARLTTCYLALGFLTGAVERATGREALGTETHCQSRLLPLQHPRAGLRSEDPVRPVASRRGASGDRRRA